MESKKEALLIPQDISNTRYKGYITVRGREFKISLKLKHPGTFKDVQFSCCGELSDILKCYRGPLISRLEKCSSLVEFLSELEIAIENFSALAGNGCDETVSTPASLETMINELEGIGWNNTLSISNNFKELKLSYVDINERAHILALQLDPEHPRRKPYCITDTPLPMNLIWPPKDENFVQYIYDQFVQHINSFQDLWAMLQEIDEKCWVLEPEKPKMSSIFRRIVLNNNSSLLLTLNPRKPKLFPECKFFGPEHSINPIKEKLYAGLHRWSNIATSLSNLQEILQIDFPSKEDTELDDFDLDCGICYSYKLEDLVPEKTCEQPKCGKMYHNACLLEWLRTLPNYKQSFNVVFGECPHCSASLTIKLS